MGGCELVDDLHSDSLSHFLMLQDKLLQNFDQNFLDLTCEHLASFVLVSNLLQFLIVLHEESQIVIGNVNRQICAVQLLLFFGGLSSAERVLLYLVLDLFGLVSHEYS